MRKFFCLILACAIVVIYCGKNKEHTASKEEVSVVEASGKELIEILNSRPRWDIITVRFKEFICNRLNDEKVLKEFADLVEKYGILENNMSKYDTTTQEEDWFFFGLSVTLTSVANHFGGKEEFDLSKKIAEFAIKFNPNHLPAYSSLALACCFSGNKDLALSTCKKAKTLFKEKAVFDKEDQLYKIRPGYETLTPEMWEELEQTFYYIEHECGKR